MPRGKTKTKRSTSATLPPPTLGTSIEPPGTGDKSDSFPIVGVGASAGGLDAFRELLTNLPTDTGMLLFSLLWLLVVYCPVAHWVWGEGWLQKMGIMAVIDPTDAPKNSSDGHVDEDGK